MFNSRLEADFFSKLSALCLRKIENFYVLTTKHKTHYYKMFSVRHFNLYLEI